LDQTKSKFDQLQRDFQSVDNTVHQLNNTNDQLQQELETFINTQILPDVTIKSIYECQLDRNAALQPLLVTSNNNQALFDNVNSQYSDLLANFDSLAPLKAIEMLTALINTLEQSL
jgi:outer membrane murein-binding lipoprotein Lpp